MKKKLEKLGFSEEYSIKSCANNKMQIITSTKSDKDKLMNFLKVPIVDGRQTQFHTFTENVEKHHIFVLKGHYYMDNKELLSLLKTNNVPVLDVTFLNKSLVHPSYMVHFEKDIIKRKSTT
jgi:hypothetical protein